MAKLTICNDWWTAPAEGESGNLILVTGRRGMDNVIATGVYRYRVEVTWPYEGDSKGLPAFADSKVMEEVTDALNASFDRDPVAVMTGIYTGDGQRNWVFYKLLLEICYQEILMLHTLLILHMMKLHITQEFVTRIRLGF